jgi:hypothetical protein
MKNETVYQVWRVDAGGDKHLNGSLTQPDQIRHCVEAIRAYHGKNTKVEIEPPLPGKVEVEKPAKPKRSHKKAKPVAEEAVA